MQITFDLPDELAWKLGETPAQLSRRALETLAVDAYRRRQLSTAQVQRLLDLPSPLAADAFLKSHEAYLPYSLDDFEQDLAAIARAREES